MKLLLLDRPVDCSILEKEDVEFFGPWAQPIKLPDELKPAGFEPYPTSDAVYDAGIRSVRNAGRILEKLCSIMPELTGVSNMGDDFWKLLLSRHVVGVCGIIEDIQTRMQALPDKEYFLGISQESFDIKIPTTWTESTALIFNNDAFRCQIASLMLGEIYPQTKPIGYEFYKVFRYNTKRSLKESLKYCINYLKNNRHRNLQRVLESYRKLLFPVLAKPKNIKSLIWDTEHYFFSMLRNDFILRDELINGADICSFPMSISANREKRDRLKSALEFPFGKIMAATLPVSSLEGLKKVVEAVDLSALKKYPNLKRIYTHGRIIVESDFWRVAGALMANMGFKLYSVQHGGGINYFSHPSIFLEGEIVEEYLSWGFNDWHSDKQETFARTPPRPMPSLYLSQLKKIKYGKKISFGKKKWEAIFLVLAENKGIKWLYSPLFPDLAQDYFKRQEILFESFSTRKTSMVKLYPVEYGWNHKTWLDKRFPELEYELGGKNFVDHVKDAEIVIIDYNSTGFLEMLVLEKPFLCSWNRKWYRGNTLFESCLDKLKAVGIFFETAEELVKVYDQTISMDIKAWWNSGERIETVRKIARKIAMTSDRAYEIWYRELTR